MSILKYFQPVTKKSPRDQLPDPNGPLNNTSSAIASANIAVQAVLESSETSEAASDSSS